MIANHQRLLVVSLRRALLQGAFVSLLASASPAALAEGAEAAAPANALAAADATTSEAAQLGNVTVTAQSRTQEVQDVPIPIQIVTTKQIESLQATATTMAMAATGMRCLIRRALA